MVWNSQNKPDEDYQVVITEKNGQKKKFFRNGNGATAVLLWEKYGYAFPSIKQPDFVDKEVISNICIGESDKPGVPIWYRPSANSKPVVYLRVDSAGLDLNRKRINYRPVGINAVFLVNGKIYTKTEMENTSAQIQTKDGPQNVVSAEYVVYHPNGNKADIEKYGPIARDGIYEFVNVRESKL